MKKIKKTLAVLLTLILLLGLCLCLTGCSVDPYALDIWYLTGYTDENEEFHNVGYNTIKQEILYSDDITIQYFEDGTFIFKEFDKEYTGTYTYKSGRKESSVALTFSDGTKGNGTCAEYMFDGVWYEGTLQVFGKEYYFAEDWIEEDMSERYDSPYTHVGESITEMLKSGKTEIRDHYHSSSYTLYKGEIELRGEEYWFVPNNLKKAENNLSQAYELYTYEFTEDGSVQRGDNLLREGKCFINYNAYRVRLDSEYTETRYEYAVWYYKDFFETIYPYANLEFEDVLSIRADRLDTSSDSYATYIWEKGSKELKNYYELCSAQYVLSKTELSGTEQDLSEQIIYYIKTTEQTYKIVFNFIYDYSSIVDCIVEGKYYKNLSYSRLSLVPRGENYRSLKIESGGAKFYIGEDYVKTYDYLLDNVIFEYGFIYEDQKSEYVLKAGKHTLILLDNNRFIWQTPYGSNVGCKIIGDVDFSVIFEEYPLINES